MLHTTVKPTRKKRDWVRGSNRYLDEDGVLY